MGAGAGGRGMEREEVLREEAPPPPGQERGPTVWPGQGAQGWTGQCGGSSGRQDLWVWNTQRPGSEDSSDAPAPTLKWALSQVLHS